MQDKFAKRPVVRSVKALNEATALIIQLRKMQQRAEANLELELAAVRTRHAKHFLVPAAGERISIGERLEQLESAVTSYTKRNAPKVFEPGQRHRHLPGATIQLQAEAGSIEFAEGHHRRSAAAELVNVEGWQTAVAELLESFGLSQWIQLVPEIAWESLKRGIRSGQIKPDELLPYGMYWEQNEVARVQKPRDQWKKRSL